MAIPKRLRAPGTYFVTTATWNRRRLFQSNAAAHLFIDTLQHYRREGRYKLHAFVVMQDHIHLLITPHDITIERAVMLIKGGFSRRLESKVPAWQRGFSEHRIRNREDFLQHRDYIHHNPVRARMCQHPNAYPFSSACTQQTPEPEDA